MMDTDAAPGPNDLDTAASRFANALRRIRQGLNLQRQRVLDRATNATRLPGNQEGAEVVVLSGPDNDLDYYIYELGRLQDLGREVLRVFAPLPQIRAALERFDAAIPKLRMARNPLTHPSNDARLDRYATFSSGVLLHPDGSVESLVDPRYEQHEAAIAFAGEIADFLRSHIQEGIRERAGQRGPT